MKFVIVALLGAVTPFVSAAAIEARAFDDSTPMLVFHNEKGEVVGQRSYTPEELAGLQDPQGAQNATSGHGVEKRANGDHLFFRSHTFSTCASAGGETWCSPPYFDLEVNKRNEGLCAGITIERSSWKSNPCHKTFKVAGTTYLVDNCDNSLDWSVEPLSSREIGVLKVNGVRRGGCFAIAHTNELGPTCISGTVGNTWMRIAFCINEW